MAYGKAIAALADPTRLHLFEKLRKGPVAVGVLAKGLRVSRPAVSQHLKVLEGAGLVSARRDGTRRIYQVEVQGLVELRRYLDSFWGATLEAFKKERSEVRLADMYVPAHFEEKDPATLRALVAAHPLGAWVTSALVVNHIPFLLRGDTLVGHVARANDVWKSLEGESVVIFQGPEAYITPSWYAAKKEHGKVVPTWNYAVVHVHGTPRAIDDADWLLALVTELTDTNEAGKAKPWKVTDAPDDYVRASLKAIVGIEIPIRVMVGKWKASQNRSPADRAGVVTGLREAGQGDAADLVSD